MKLDARPTLKTTPYTMTQQTVSYSRWRTSKVTYINENLNENAKKISRAIELVTRSFLKKQKYDSENFQVMNYGMGGLISAHVDSNNWITNQDNEGLQTSE